MAVEVIGPALIDRTVEMSFFIFFMMLLFSNIITSFSTFFNNRELDFLFSLPVRPTTIYLAKLFENAVYASWATMVIAFPLIIAYGVCHNASFIYYPISIAGAFIYIIIPAAAASIMIFAIASLFPRLRPRNVIFVALFFIIAITFLYVKIDNPALFKVFETENELELLKFASNLTTVSGSFVPSTWLSMVIRDFTQPRGEGWLYFLLLLFVCASSVIAAYFIARLVYHRSWLSVGEHSSKKSVFRSFISGHEPSGERSLLLKDILLFVREPTQWVQLAIFIVLLVIYVFSLRRTPLYFVFPLWRTIVSFANFAYVSFVLATVGVRFIFPAISLERRGLWILASSPLTIKKIVRVKYFFNLVTSAAIAEALLIMSNLLIKTDPAFHFTLPVFMLFVAAALVSINLGMGCLFPQFDEDNPSKIAAGTGGIMTALASIAYVGISIVLLAAPAHAYLMGRHFNRPASAPVIFSGIVLFMILSIAAIFLPLKLGARALEKRDL
jgi:ABC-2 type transport system permease protein